MANPFDQFDAPATSNPFDAFDDPSFKPPKPSGLLRRGIGDTAVSLGKGVIGLGEGAVGLSSLATGGLAGQLAEQAGFRPKEAKAMLDEFYSPEQQAANRAVSDAKGFGGTLSSILQNPSVVPQMVAESLPSMIGGQAIAKGALKAAGLAGEAITPTAARWAGAGGEGAITAGGVAEQIRQDNPNGNIYAAVPAGVATGLIGVAGGKLANRMGLGDVDTALLTAANRGTASLPKRILGGVASEGLLEEMPQSMQEQFFQNLGTGKPLGEGVAEAGASGLVTGGAMGGAFGILHKPAGPLSRAADTSIQSGAAQEQQRVAAEHAAQAIGQPPSSAQAVSRGDSAPSTEESPVRTTSSDADQQNSSSSPLGFPQYNGPTQYVHPDGSVSTDPQAIRSAIEAERMASLAPQPYDAPLEEAKATRREQMARAQERAKPMPTTNVAAAQQKAAALTEQTGIPHSVVPTGNEIGGKPLVIVQPEQANGAIPGTTPAEVVLQGADAQGLEPARSAGDVERNAAVGGNDGADAGAAALGVRPDTAVRDVAGGERVDAPLYPTPKRSDSPSWVIRNKETGEVQFETFDRKKVDALNTAKYEAVPILHYLQEINRKVANAPQAQGARPAGVEAQPVLRGIPGETAAQRPDAGQDATAQGASVPNAAQAPDVAGKTPDQLAYLATNGKPGWKEAAQAEIARRDQSGGANEMVPAPAATEVPGKSHGSSPEAAPQQTLDRAAAEARYKEILRQYGSKTVGKMWKPSTPLEIKTEAEQLRNILAPQQGQPNAQAGSSPVPAGEAVDASKAQQVAGEAQAPAGEKGASQGVIRDHHAYADAPPELRKRIDGNKVAILVRGSNVQGAEYVLYEDGTRTHYTKDWKAVQGEASGKDAVGIAMRYRVDNDIVAVSRAAADDMASKGKAIEDQRKSDQAAKEERERAARVEAELREKLRGSLRGEKFRRGTFQPKGGDKNAAPIPAWFYGETAVHKSIGHFLRGQQYTVSHAKTGFAILQGFKSMESAKLAAARLDRSGPLSELKDPGDLKKPEFNKFRNIALAIKSNLNDPLASPEIDARQEETSPNGAPQYVASVAPTRSDVDAETMETRTNVPQVAQPTPTKTVTVASRTLSGPKNVRAKLYELPGYNGPQLAVVKYGSGRGQGYRVYLPKTGAMVADNNGVMDLNETLKLAVLRVQNARNTITKRESANQKGQPNSREGINPVSEQSGNVSGGLTANATTPATNQGVQNGQEKGRRQEVLNEGAKAPSTQGESSPSVAKENSPEQTKQQNPTPAKASKPPVEVSNAGGAKSDDISKPETPKNDAGSGSANADRADNAQDSKTNGEKPLPALSEIARRLGIAVETSRTGFHASSDGKMVVVPQEDRDAKSAVSANHILAHELGHAIIARRGLNFRGIPGAKIAENWRELLAASKEFRPGVWNHARDDIRAHAKKPNEILADAIASVLMGEKPVSMLKPFMEKTGTTLRDLGLQTIEEANAEYRQRKASEPIGAQGKESAVSLPSEPQRVKESAKTDTRSAENEQKAPDSVSTGEQKGGAKFSRNTTATTIDSAALKQTVAFLRKAYPQATIREHESDQSPTVPKPLRDDIANSGAQGDVAGAYKDGVVHVFRSGIRDQAHAEKTIVHELTHRGLARMFGLGIKQPMLGIYASNADIATEADRIAKQYGYDLATAVEEALADLGGDMVSVKGFDKLVAYVRAALRKLGLVSEWSNNDVALLVQRAREKNKGGFTESAKFAPAWHGSPHDFDRFSTENIGTGEGAQAYGHGLYFAGAKEVAEYYRDNVKNMARVDEINKELSSIAKEMAKHQTGYRQYLDPKGYELANQYDALMDEKAGIRDAKGRLYQVELAPKEDEYLLWGKPLSEQSEKVKAALASLGIEDYRSEFIKLFQERLGGSRSDAEISANRFAQSDYDSNFVDLDLKRLAKNIFKNRQERALDGSLAYLQLMRREGGQEFASDRMLAAGIRGIKYLDGSSRSHGDGNYNYVIFNDADVSITAKYSRSAQAFARATDSAAFQKSGEILSDLFTTHGTFGALKGLKTQYHKATLNPMFKAFWERANAMAMDSARSMSRPADLASRILPKFDPRNMGDAAKALFAGRSDVLPGDLKAVSRALSDGTLDGGPSPLKGKVWTDEELSKRGMNDKQASLYREARAAIDSSLTEVAAATAWSLARRSIENDFLRQRVAEAPEEASVILPMAMDYAIAREVEKLREAQDGMAEAYDPEAAAKEMESIQKHLSAMQDDASSISAIFDKAEALKQAGYMPLMRFGKYRVAVTMRENGKETATYVSRHESNFEANQARRELEKKFSGKEFTVGPVSIENENAWKMFKGVNPETVMLFAEEAGIKADDIMQQWYREAVSSRSALKRMIERTGVAGYSEDLPRVLASFITSNGKQAGYAYHLGDMQEMLQNKDMPGDVQEEAQSLLETIQEPTEAGSKMRGLMAMWYLLGSIGSALVNSTQTVTMSIPWLSQFGAKGFSATEAASAMGKAYKIVVNPITMPADLKAAMKRAEQNGTVDSNEVFHLYAESMKPMISKLGSGNRAYRARAFMTLWGAPFAMVETLNRRATFAAAYSMAKAQGKSEGDAAKFAERAVIETQGIYAKHNRPNWSRGAIGAATLTFKQFSIAYVEMLSRMAKNGPEGKKAALLTLGILMALSGASGLPGEDDLLDVIDTFSQIFFDKPTLSRMEIRNFLHDNLGKELGGFVNSGVSNFLPVDVSSRLGLGNLIPGTGLFKPSEKNKTGELLEIFAGVQGGFVRSMVDSVRMIAEGNVSGAIKSAAPKAIQDVAKGVEMLATGEARDRAGRKVVDASPSDSIWQMIGLNPNVKAEAGKKAWDVTEYMGYVKRAESNIVGRWARGIADGDMEAIHEAQQALTEWNLRNPDSPIGVSHAQIMQRVQALRSERSGRIEKTAPMEMRARARELMGED